MATTLVYETNENLVALYRFVELSGLPGATSGMVFNRSQSTVYGGSNDLSISGGANGIEVRTPDATVLSQAPKTSGARSSGTTLEILHLPYSPVQSGNASGIDASSTQDMSYGGWLMFGYDDTPPATIGDFISKWANAAGQQSYVLGAQSGATPPEWKWRAGVGITNGDSTTSVSSPYLLTSGKYEHVVCTINAQTAVNNVILYVSGLAVATGSITFSPGTSGAFPHFRVFSSTSAGAEFVNNGVGSRGAEVAEVFLIRQNLTPEQVSGIYTFGFQDGLAPGPSGMSNSDLNDSQKDNIGEQSSGLCHITFTAWRNTESANPSGGRHATSGFHPAWIQLIGRGATSGLNFGPILQGTSSGVRVITFRNTTPNTRISGMKFWMSDFADLPSSGWNISYHCNSRWLPNLTLPSGSGMVGRSYAAASSVLRSDGGLTISGYNLNGLSQSGEQEISQYVYLGFTSDGEFTSPGTYGPDGFAFRLSAYNV